MKIFKFKLFTYQNRLPHFGVIQLGLEPLGEQDEHEIVEEYCGAGFVEEGEPEVLSADGYDKWKEGIRRGVRYALSKLKNPHKFKVTIIKAIGEHDDTNPTIMGFVAARAILNNHDNSESKEERNRLSKLVFTSWLYGFDGMPDFDQMKMENIKQQPRKPKEEKEGLFSRLKAFFGAKK